MSLKKFFNRYKGGNLSKNKVYEIQSFWMEDTFSLGFNIQYNRKCDHAGLSIDLQFLGLYVTFTINDTRHWDEENDCYKVYKEK